MEIVYKQDALKAALSDILGQRVSLCIGPCWMEDVSQTAVVNKTNCIFRNIFHLLDSR